MRPPAHVNTMAGTRLGCSGSGVVFGLVGLRQVPARIGPFQVLAQGRADAPTAVMAMLD